MHGILVDLDDLMMKAGHSSSAAAFAGVRVAPPWQLDTSHPVRPGENRAEIPACATLAKHYGTIPTRYRGSATSGLVRQVRGLSGARSGVRR